MSSTQHATIADVIAVVLDHLKRASNGLFNTSSDPSARGKTKL